VKNRGFTLIEVTLGLAILILIFGVIFQLVQISVLGADAAGRNSLRSREVSGLFALIRQLCLDLPIRSQLALEPRAGGGYDLVLSNAPVAILPTRDGGTTTLRLLTKKDRVTGAAQLTLEEVFQRTNQTGRIEEPLTNSFLLMQDLVTVDWFPGNPLNRERMEEPGWTDPIKPAYLKLQLVRREAGRNATNTGIFWIPTGYGPGGQPPVDPVTRAPVTVTNTNPPTG